MFWTITVGVTNMLEQLALMQEFWLCVCIILISGLIECHQVMPKRSWHNLSHRFTCYGKRNPCWISVMNEMF